METRRSRVARAPSRSDAEGALDLGEAAPEAARRRQRHPQKRHKSLTNGHFAATPRPFEGSVGPLATLQPTAPIPPSRPPTSAVRGWPHWNIAVKTAPATAAIVLTAVRVSIQDSRVALDAACAWATVVWGRIPGPRQPTRKIVPGLRMLRRANTASRLSRAWSSHPRNFPRTRRVHSSEGLVRLTASQ